MGALHKWCGNMNNKLGPLLDQPEVVNRISAFVQNPNQVTWGEVKNVVIDYATATTVETMVKAAWPKHKPAYRNDVSIPDLLTFCRGLKILGTTPRG